MLELAYLNKEELQKKFLSVAFVEKYKYYDYGVYVEYDLNLKNSSWDALQFVSKDNGNILGYLSARLDRTSGSVSAISVINFGDKNVVFAKDFHKFMTDLFDKYGFYKINFEMLVGNPAEAMYDRFVKKYNGRIVGTYKRHIKLWTGEYCDVKAYEIFKDDYDEIHRGKVA